MSYICKIANYEELIEKCDYEINRHPGNAVWTHSKQIAIDGFNNQSKIIICTEVNKFKCSYKHSGNSKTQSAMQIYFFRRSIQNPLISVNKDVVCSV